MQRITCTTDFGKGRLVRVGIMAAVLIFWGVAETALASAGIELPATVPSEPSILESMDSPRNYLSEKVVDISTEVDHFFGDPRYFQEYNKSVIQIYLNQSIVESGNFTTWIDGQAKIDLPSAEKRFHLVLESDPEKKAANETKLDQTAQPKDTKLPKQYAASLRYERAEESLWHYSADSGVNVQFPLDPFIRTRGSYEVPLEDWRLKLAETVFWFSTLGLGQTIQFDMTHVLGEPLLFRATSTATCFESPQLCNLRQDLSLYHTVNDRNAVLYQLSMLGDDNPRLKETAYVLLVRYRYKLHREWMYFEVTPQLSFPRTDDFRMNGSLLFRLEMLFGATN